MSETNDVVFIADRITLLGFMPLGVGCVPLEEVAGRLDSVARRQYLRDAVEGAKLVVVSHEAQLQLGEDLDAVTNPSGLPLVVAIPGALGSRGDRGERIRRLVERAMGADLFSEDSE